MRKKKRKNMGVSLGTPLGTTIFYLHKDDPNIFDMS
jgi:hypothetical protein